MSNTSTQLAKSSLIDLRLLRMQHAQVLSNLQACFAVAVDNEDYDLCRALHAAISVATSTNWAVIEETLKLVVSRDRRN